jgi:hypothetical protein
MTPDGVARPVTLPELATERTLCTLDARGRLVGRLVAREVGVGAAGLGWTAADRPRLADELLVDRKGVVVAREDGRAGVRVRVDAAAEAGGCVMIRERDALLSGPRITALAATIRGVVYVLSRAPAVVGFTGVLLAEYGVRVT